MLSYTAPRQAVEEIVLEEVQSVLVLLGATHSEHCAISVRVMLIAPPGGLIL